MKFQYKKLGTQILRPVIPIGIVSDTRSVRYEVLVDSSADCNIVPADLAELLDIDFMSGEEIDVGGITGSGMSFFVHQVTIRVGGWDIDVSMGFMPNMPPFGYGVVGQRGFFDFFRVNFDYRKGEIEVKPY